MTLRRDIAHSWKRRRAYQGSRRRTLDKFLTASDEDDFGKRLYEATEEKSRIAECASGYIEPGHSIFIDSGTTALRLASMMPDERLTVTTTGPHIALELAKKQKPIINLVGGMINHENLSVSGMQAVKFIDVINIDTAFIVPSGFSRKCGFSCGNYSECELKKYIVDKARRVIMLMDGDKLDRNLPYTFCTPRDLDILITDRELPEETEQMLRDAGTEIVIAK